MLGIIRTGKEEAREIIPHCIDVGHPHLQYSGQFGSTHPQSVQQVWKKGSEMEYQGGKSIKRLLHHKLLNR